MMIKHIETHKLDRIGWLRAAVLGANDGIVSTASLIVGVAAAHASHHDIIISGVAGLSAGAMSMAAGEYVSVSSQADTEKADIAREKEELANNITYEIEELTQIYIDRGLEPPLANEVAKQLMKHDALGSHARDELGLSIHNQAKPLQAAVASAMMFATGALLPILIVLFSSSGTNLILSVSIMSLSSLAALGIFAAHMGGANKFKSCIRVVMGGGFAMAITSAIGAIFGTN